MTGVDLVLDTNAVIAISHESPEALRKLAQAETAAVTLFTLGELEFGALKSQRFAENRRSIALLRERVALLLPDDDTAHHYAYLKWHLRKQGRPIPENDLWIAAIARQHGLPLMTRDQHFTRLSDLRVVSW